MSQLGGPLPEVDEENREKIDFRKGWNTFTGSIGQSSTKSPITGSGEGGLFESESDAIDKGISNITTSISNRFNQLKPEHQKLLLDSAELIKGAYKYTKENPIDTYILPSAAIHTVESLGKFWQMGHGFRSFLLQNVGIDKGAADKIALGRQLFTGRPFPKARIPGVSVTTSPYVGSSIKGSIPQSGMLRTQLNKGAIDVKATAVPNVKGAIPAEGSTYGSLLRDFPWLTQNKGGLATNLAGYNIPGAVSANTSRAYMMTQPSKVGNATARHFKLDISPNTPNYIDEVGMNVEAGQNWLKQRQELYNKWAKVGTKKEGNVRVLSFEEFDGMVSDIQSQIDAIRAIPVKKQTTAQRSLKKKLIDEKDRLNTRIKYLESLMNTGPNINQDIKDVLIYGPKGIDVADNPLSTMAALKGTTEGWTPQAHKSTDWHHWWLNELTTPLNRRLRELIRLKKARPNDELNLHAFTWLKGRTFGSRVSGGKGLENTAHQAIHKVGAATETLSENLIREGPRIEPATTPFSSKPLNKTKPPNNINVDGKDVSISTADWKIIQQADLEVNSFDASRIMKIYQQTDNLPFAIQQLKEFKFDGNGNISRMYQIYGPDNLSEMQRWVKRINQADSAAEILALAKEMDQTLTQPLSEMMEWANDYALSIGPRKLMTYTHKPKEFYKDAAEWYLEQLDKQAFKEETFWIDRHKQAEEVQRVNKLIYQDRDLYGE